MRGAEPISIGDLARRTGLSVSAIRFYEDKGLIFPSRDAGGRRRFMRSDTRKLSFVMIAQRLGFSLKEIKSQLDTLPGDRPPTLKQWRRISSGFRESIEDRIETLILMRDRLDGCIGCGCLSLKKCALYNEDDLVRRSGPGPRYLMGDEPADA